jgi:hypothetical protein
MTSACKAMTLASALVVGTSVPALAQDPSGPAANRTWGGCLLTETIVSDLEDVLNASAINNANVSFIVVYSQEAPNGGFKLTGTSFTGPVICTDPAEVDITARDKDGNPLMETTDIPTQTNPGGNTVDIRSAEEESILQLKINGGSNAGDIVNRVCHTTDANVDCFLIFPP